MRQISYGTESLIWAERELDVLCYFENAQQSKGSQHTDAERGTWFHRSPNNFKYTSHDDLQEESILHKAKLLLSSGENKDQSLGCDGFSKLMN